MDKCNVLIGVVILFFYVVEALVISMGLAVLWGWIVNPNYWFWMMGAIPLYMTWEWTLANPILIGVGFFLSVFWTLSEFKPILKKYGF